MATGGDRVRAVVSQRLREGREWAAEPVQKWKLFSQNHVCGALNVRAASSHAHALTHTCDSCPPAVPLCRLVAHTEATALAWGPCEMGAWCVGEAQLCARCQG